MDFKRFFICVSIFLLVSCHSEKNAQNDIVCDIGDEVCKVFIPEYAEDSIQVFTSKYKQAVLNDKYKQLNFKSRNISENDIIESEKILRNDNAVLNSFLELHGKKSFSENSASESGYFGFGLFQMVPIEKYKRQYVGIVAQDEKPALLVLLFYDKDVDEMSHQAWMNQIFISITLTEQELQNRYFLFQINTSTNQIKKLRW